MSSAIGWGGGEPDPIFVGVVLSYIDEHPSTFGGVWVDRAAGGTVVVAFTDDPKPHRSALPARRPSPSDDVPVEPRPPIVDGRPIGKWDQTFDVVQVPYSEADIESTQEELLGRLPSSIEGLEIDFDQRRNRLAIWGVDPADERLIEAVAAVPADRLCVAAGSPFDQGARFEPGDPLDIIPERTADG